MPSTGVAVRTPKGLLKGVGRLLLWSLVLLLLVRGAGSLLAVREPVPVPRESPAVEAAWPDDEAQTFALEFTRAYLGYVPRERESYTRGLERFASPVLAGSMAPKFAQRGPSQVVSSVAVARVVAVDKRHALVTVAAALSARGMSTRYLTVPVARDARGGLAVFDLPSFAPPPARGELGPPATQSLAGAVHREIEDVLGRFFRPYLAGEASELEYVVPSGVRIGALAQRHEFLGLVSVAQTGARTGQERTVLATVRARDLATGAVYTLRYRLRLVRGDRWYVAAVNSANPKEG